MPLSVASIRAVALRWIAQLHSHTLAEQYASAEPPLRAELFSADQMERHGTTLADLHQLGMRHDADQLLERLG